MKDAAGIKCVDMNPPEGDAWTLQQHAVVSRDLLSQVWQQWDVNVAQTSSLTEHKDTMEASVTLLNYQTQDAIAYHRGGYTFRGVLIHARCVKWESTDTPTTSQLTSWNSLALSLNAIISVGHTKVLQQNSTTSHSYICKRPWNGEFHSQKGKSVMQQHDCTNVHMDFFVFLHKLIFYRHK